MMSQKTSGDEIRDPLKLGMGMAALEYFETFVHALDSVCVVLELSLDKDAASDEPMADVVRSEIEDEFEIYYRDASRCRSIGMS